jgi:DNA-binding MarR family transcriptional regulator
MDVSESHGGYVAVPAYLFDVVLPQVTDSEWRLLCIILRQTVGWRRKGGRYKEWDWLSHGQLKARMNRSSATVSKAVDSLVRKGLIEVATSSGKPLVTTVERRNAHARLYFRLNPKALGNSTRFHKTVTARRERQQTTEQKESEASAVVLTK